MTKLGWALGIAVGCSLAGCFDGGGTTGEGTQAEGSAGTSAGPVAGTGASGGADGAGQGSGDTAGAGGGGSAGTAAGAGGEAGAAGAGGEAGAAGADGTAGTAGGDGSGGVGGSVSKHCDLACDVGTHCELVEVVCIQAPCLPVPECVEDPACGGFAGFLCPGMGTCHDDPRDDCNPEAGGADCGGLCGCAEAAHCADGQVWDSTPSVCACVAADGTVDGGEPCGMTTCEKGMVCCNASCGICAPPDGVCTQIACL